MSTNSGLPDYRTNGNLLKIFTRYSSNKTLFADPEFQSFVETLKTCEPTKSHEFAKFLFDLGILKRVYTQNIDGLYHRVLPADKIVEFSGSVRDQNIVLYGNEIEQRVLEQVKQDFLETEVDLIIVMGTSLQVAPFCTLPNLVSKTCTRVLCDRNPSFSNNFTYIKYDTFVKFSSGKLH